MVQNETRRSPVSGGNWMRQRAPGWQNSVPEMHGCVQGYVGYIQILFSCTPVVRPGALPCFWLLSPQQNWRDSNDLSRCSKRSGSLVQRCCQQPMPPTETTAKVLAIVLPWIQPTDQPPILVTVQFLEEPIVPAPGACEIKHLNRILGSRLAHLLLPGTACSGTGTGHRLVDGHR